MCCVRVLARVEKINLVGKTVAVLGGGNVALDTSSDRSPPWCRKSLHGMSQEPRGEMPGFQWEIGVAEQEGVIVCPGRTFKEIVVVNEIIKGVRSANIVFRGFKHGRPDFDEVPGSEHVIPADLVIWAIGQAPNFSFLPQDGKINTHYPIGVQSDAEMMTTLKGVFVAGDVHRGVTFFVVDAINEGHHAARSIDQFLR